MKKKSNLLLVLLLLAVISINNFPQESSYLSDPGLLGAILKLEDYLKKTDIKIKRYENSIIKCDKTITTAANIINTARQDGNTEAERVANDALIKSTNARQKNITLLSSANFQKKQYESILTSLKNQANLPSSNTNKKSTTLLGYSGSITINKNNGKEIKLDETNSSLLEIGDIISTSGNSKIELQFLEGRGNFVLGENSKIKFNKDDSTDVIDLLEGKVKMNIKKAEAFYDDLEKKYEVLMQSGHPIDKGLELLYKNIRMKTKKLLAKKFEVRTPSAVTSIRGTEFITTNYDNRTEIIVIEGTVELKSNVDQKTVLIMTGQKGVVNNDGSHSEPQVIDLEKLENWWNDEE